MKTISQDRGHIDYTYGNCGVRACFNLCQPIIRDDENSNWRPREKAETIPIPVAESILGLQIRDWTPISALALAVAHYEDKEHDPELRSVLMGWISFAEALSRTAKSST